MRIGLMLRAFSEKGGVGVYTRNITRHLIETDTDNEYFLYYSSAEFVGSFANCPNATERVVSVGSKVLWDQLAMPYWFRKDKLDAIFHPKFTVPLLCGSRSVMVLHGAGWFIPETRKFWSLATRIYARIMMPIYCRVAGKVIAVSDITRDVFIEKLGVSPTKIKRVYFAPGTQFRRRYSAEEVAEVRQKYQLPDNFILTISGGDRDDRKNFGTILEAYQKVYASHPCNLVVAGRGCEQFRERYQIPDDGYGAAITFPGWVDQQDLPALYQMATVFVYPSNMEAHPIPVTEALTTQTPMVTSNVFGLQELAGDAAILVNPADADEIADGIVRLLRDPELRADLQDKARERSRLFSWDRCAAETLEEIHAVGTR
jgi:glycosyltransferase involved in cell wall biosynthesis